MDVQPLDGQFETITSATPTSLTLVVDDIMRHRRESLIYPRAAAVDFDIWLNALQRQANPLIQSGAGRADLEAWLAAVETQLD